jgi:hypothetical protein
MDVSRQLYALAALLLAPTAVRFWMVTRAGLEIVKTDIVISTENELTSPSQQPVTILTELFRLIISCIIMINTFLLQPFLLIMSSSSLSLKLGRFSVLCTSYQIS